MDQNDSIQFNNLQLQYFSSNQISDMLLIFRKKCQVRVILVSSWYNFLKTEYEVGTLTWRSVANSAKVLLSKLLIYTYTLLS